MATFGSHVGNHQFQPFLSGVYAGVIAVHSLFMYDAGAVTRIAGGECEEKDGFISSAVHFMRLPSELVPRMRVILLALCTIVGAVEITSSCLDGTAPFGSLTICLPWVSKVPSSRQGIANHFILHDWTSKHYLDLFGHYYIILHRQWRVHHAPCIQHIS